MSAAALRTGQCPNCGANLEFKVGSARVVVCEFCKTAVARKGQDLAAVGQVADLIPTGSKLELGQTGRYEGVAFTLAGRVQLEWQGGVWDEWYASFTDGRWGWVAEAQGRYYVMNKVASRAVPARGRARAGERVFFEGLGKFVVSDVKSAKLASCQGELPDEVSPGESTLSVDLEGQHGAFATVDYGSADGDPIQIFVGKAATLAQLGLGEKSGKPGTGPRPTGEALKCPSCNGAVELRLPEQTKALTCAYCNAVLDPSQGALQLISVQERLRHRPPVALGSQGNLRGKAVMAVGWMRRSCVVDGTTYDWEELLLYEEKSTSFSWLVCSDGHWCLAEPLSAAEVEAGTDASYQGQRYRRFSDVEGKVEEVLGEFYWEVRVGDTAHLVDFVAPPSGLSLEESEGEVNWSTCSYLTPAEVGAAFQAPKVAERSANGVGAFQPWPHEEMFKSVSHWVVAGLVAVMLVFVGLVATDHGELVLDKTFDSVELTQPEPVDPNEPPTPDARQHTFLSPPLSLASAKPLQVHFDAPVNNGWAAVGGALINQDTNEAAPFGLEAAYYSGVEDGESWSEGSQDASEELSAVPAGRYVVRADVQWDPKLGTPPPIHLLIRGGGVSGWQWLWAMVALCLPLGMYLQRSSFEKERWYNSNVYNPYSDDEDE